MKAGTYKAEIVKWKGEKRPRYWLRVTAANGEIIMAGQARKTNPRRTLERFLAAAMAGRVEVVE